MASSKTVDTSLKDEKRRFEVLHLRFFILLITTSLLPLIVIGLGAWMVFGQMLHEKSVAHLQTIVQDHATTIDVFLEERMRALELVALSHEQSELNDKEQLTHLFRILNRSHPNSFSDLGIIDETGRHLAYVGPHDLMDKNYRDSLWFDQVKKKGSYISDMFLGFREKPHFVMAVKREEKSHFWILRASINSDFFSAMVSKGRLGATGDCFLVDRNERYQTNPANGHELLEKCDVSITTDFQGTKTVSTISRDEQQVIRTMKWVKNGQWLLVVQQEKDEFMNPVTTATYRGILIFGIGFFAIVLVAFFSTRFLVRIAGKAMEEKESINSQFLQASKLAAIGELATGLAHEINNPLAIIISEQTNVSDLLEEMKGDESQIEELKESVILTRKQVMRCKAITQKMLKFGRQGVAVNEIIDPKKEMIEIARLMSQQAVVNNVEMIVECESNIPEIRIDSSEFQQIVTNILNNAIQAIDGNGGILVSLHYENGLMHLTIEDTGKGIPDSEIEKIFTPFYTTKPVGKGTGLGLSVCYGIATKWRGSIEAKSIENGGAVFDINFPVHETR